MLSLIATLLKGFCFPLYLCTVGTFFTAALARRLLRFPRRAGRLLFKTNTSGGYSPRRAMAVALAGTLGVGNIVGVSVALTVGGAGAVFWMWLSALLTAFLKYGEIVLGSCHRRLRNGRYCGGPMYYMEDFGGRVSAVLFSCLCIGSSFSGCFLQMGAVFDSAKEAFSVPRVPLALCVLAAAVYVIFGGRKRLAKFSAWGIPILCAVYVLLCGTVILLHADRIPGVFVSVFRGAFSPRAAGGGVSAYLFFKAIGQGVSKGVYSHEAGCGTAPISYAGAEGGTAVGHGMLGIAEVAVDTLLLCTLTAFAILSVYPDPSASGLSGLSLVSTVFSGVIGRGGSILLALCCIVFAFSTLVCWAFYGGECITYLGGGRSALFLYRAAFCAAAGAAAFVGSRVVWGLCDFFTVAMSLLNSVWLLAGRRQIIKTTEEALQMEKP